MAEKTLWRLPEVLGRTGLSRSSVYAKIAAGEFPPPVNLGIRSVAWISDEVNDWIQKRIDESRSGV